jgi:hypothetical protein
MKRLHTIPAGRLLPLLALLAPFAAGAQTLRGSVVESTSRFPIIGAVIETLDSTGAVLNRGLSNETGAYVISRPASAARLRVVRMGYRPRDIPLPEMVGSEQHLEIAMVAIPTFLSAVNAVVAANCPRRADTQRAFGLLEQARSGLLATIVSRETNPPAIKILNFDRHSEGEDQRILHQTVRLDSSEAIATSFSAARSASRFATEGFIEDSAGTSLYFGPDADVMLDPAFAAAYCFRLRPGRTRGEIGLGFAPARSRRGRTDIEGTLWIDSVAKVVRQVQFEYVGVERTAYIRPGGEINFRVMPNGTLLIDRWFFRMLDTRVDTASGPLGERTRLTYRVMREAGGEVAWARWRDGHEWKASLATVRLKMVDKFDDPVTRAVTRLTDTDYRGAPDSTGTVVFHDVLPGPYDVEVEDSALVAQKIIVKSTTRFIAERDRLVARTVVVPPSHVFFQLACKASTTGVWLEFRLMDDKKKAVAAEWELGSDIGTTYELLRATGVTQRDGVFGFCRDVDERVALQVRMTRLDEQARSILMSVPAAKSTVAIPVVLPFRSIAWQ